MKRALLLLVIFLSMMLYCIQSMPYIVPLQGKVGGMRTLVLLENSLEREKYSLFLDDLKGLVAISSTVLTLCLVI